MPELGYNRTFPRAVILGPLEFWGASITHLNTEPKIMQIEILMSNVRATTDLGKLFIVNLNWIQLVIGLCEQYLASSQDIPYEYN